MLLKFEKDKAHSNIFEYMEQMAKHTWISKRPIVLAMGKLTRSMNSVKMRDLICRTVGSKEVL